MIERLCEFVEYLKYQDVPEEVIEGTKDRILDYLGCAFFGYEEKSSDIVSGFIKENGGKKGSTIIGNGKTSMQYAALANGILGHSKELDDEHKGSLTHLGAVIIPAALAIGERKGVNGKDLITSIVIGYEVGARIGMAVCSDVLLARGFHPTGVIGVFGSTAAASKILKLNKNSIMSAMGIAGSLASGLFEFMSDGSWTKRLHPGWAAHNGIIAALLAEKGFTGPHSVIEGSYGLANTFSNCLKKEKLFNRLGESFEILKTSYKRHGCCSFIHPLIDAALEILNKKRFDVKAIKEVKCKIFSAALPIVVEPWKNRKKVSNTVDAQFNAFHSLALSVYKGEPLWKGYSLEDLNNTSVIELAKRIKIEREESFDKEYPKNFPAEVKITLTNGQVYIKKVSTNKGSPSWPMSREEIETKFKMLCSHKCPSSQRDEIMQKIRRLESLKKVEDLCSLLGNSFNRDKIGAGKRVRLKKAEVKFNGRSLENQI